MDEPHHDPDSAYQPPTEPHQAELVEPPRSDSATMTRVWPTLLTGVAGVLAFLAASIVASIVAVVVIGIAGRPLDVQANPVELLLSNRAGLLLVMVPPQLVLAAIALLAALLSPLGVRRRLCLTRGRWPVWAWIAGAAATPLIGTLSAAALSLMVEESEHLRQITDAFRLHATSGFLLPLLVVVGLVPGFCEEIFFRGYFQSRLTRRWGSVGIWIASAFFAAFHLDLVHALAVFPLGLWLGYLVEKAGSLWPAVLAHVVNNVTSVISTIPEETDALEWPAPVITATVFLAGIPALFLTLYAARRRSPTSPPP